MIDSIEYKGYTIEIHPDEDPINPRECGGEAALIHLGHRRYNLPQEAIEPEENYSSLGELLEAMRRANKALICLPVWGYDHSGLSLKAGERTYPFDCPWDSGLAGYVVVTKESVKANYVKSTEYPTQKKWAETVAREEVDAYSRYLRGECYGFIVKDEDGEEVEDGSCWGFDDFDYCITEAKSVIDWHASNPVFDQAGNPVSV